MRRVFSLAIILDMNIDWHSVQITTAILIAAGFGLFWIISFRRASRVEADEPQRIFAEVLPLFEGAKVKAGVAKGVYKLEGSYQSRFFQLKVIVDNLAPRKLPSLWLMTTRPAPQFVPQVIDLMMRSRGPTSFSNFDLFPHQLPLPHGFPPHVSARSDQPAGRIPWDIIIKLAPLFGKETGKELLISPKGLRLVVLLAEANRARYGVFRQADFGKPVVNPSLAVELLGALIELEDDLEIQKNEESTHDSTR